MPLGRWGALLLLGPAVALMLGIFLFPILWFLVQALAELGGISDILDEAAAVIGSRAILRAILNTNWIALVVTVFVLLIGYPVAYVMSRARGLAFTMLLVCIVLPYFTSVIVRTYAWMVLLGRNGLINQALLGLGLVSEPVQLMYNRTGVIIGMVYVLLPYMVLTLFSAMRAVEPSLLRAAEGMGASPFATFRRVFFPLTLHGVIAGALIVFILAVGFFITPALMGGPDDIMIAMLIEREIELTQNWPVAALMTLVLLCVTLSLYSVYSRFSRPGTGLGA
jgi:ABC-type spermidine/putrescine transport system permease subunit I